MIGAHEIAVGVFVGLVLYKALDSFLDLFAWGVIRGYYWIRSFGK